MLATVAVVAVVLGLWAWVAEREARDLQRENSRLINANVGALHRIEELAAENRTLRAALKLQESRPPGWFARGGVVEPCA